MDKKWNLQDIKPAGTTKRQPITRHSSRPIDTEVHQRPPREEREEDNTEYVPISNGQKKKRRSVLLVFLLFTGVIGSIFVASLLSSGSEVSVYPRQSKPNVNATFSAYQTAPAGELSYDIMTLEASGERQVAASGQQNVSELAKGTIDIFKATPGTQRLIKNTRFADASGKIFRIEESVVIPGSVDGTPGRIQAQVFADEAGEAYNLPANTRLTVPGLQSDEALYNAIYATNEDSFTGGFEGQKFIIDEEQLAASKQGLQTELRDLLLERLPNEMPSGMVAFPPAVSFTYESLPAVEYGDNLATIKEKALLQIPLFAAEEFSNYLAAATIAGYDGQPTRIVDTDELLFAYTNATTSSTNLANIESISFQLAGRPTIVYTYDEGKLVTDLLGAPKNSLNTILAGYPAIERADAVIRPFWQRTFSTNLNKIEIIEIIDVN